MATIKMPKPIKRSTSENYWIRKKVPVALRHLVYPVAPAPMEPFPQKAVGTLRTEASRVDFGTPTG
jgi:hypothetical protein